MGCHDVSDGGALVALAEMCIASGLGIEIDSKKLGDPFEESPGRYLIEIDAQGEDTIRSALQHVGASLDVLGKVTSIPAALDVGRLTANRTRQVDAHIFVEELTKAWRGTLDW
jgi:phosphoribosylformylglycinamidine (FGAM) synthase-like enzyme